MEKLRALTTYLGERLSVESEQIDCRAEQVTLPLYWKPTEKGLYMGDMRYRGVLVLDHFGDNPARLVALVGFWLEVNDPCRENDKLSPAIFEVEQVAQNQARVELRLDFIEPQHLSESEDGEFEAFGKRWAFVPFDLWVAEQGRVP